MRLGIVNDLHISLDGKNSHGVNTRQNTLDVIDSLLEADIDHLYILGDVCLREPRMDTYRWLHSVLKDLNIPIHFVPGNHDDPEMIREVFGDCKVASPYQGQTLLEHPILLLDSSASRLSAEQLKWTEDQLRQIDSQFTFLMIHHPPDLMDVPYMDDQHSLQDREELLKILHASNQQMVVFAGHYHVEKTKIDRNVTISVTPSCYVQIDQESSEFKVDHLRIAYRLIDLYPGGYSTEVHYLHGNLLAV